MAAPNNNGYGARRASTSSARFAFTEQVEFRRQPIPLQQQQQQQQQQHQQPSLVWPRPYRVQQQARGAYRVQQQARGANRQVAVVQRQAPPQTRTLRSATLKREPKSAKERPVEEQPPVAGGSAQLPDIAVVSFNPIPFYEVVAEICRPTILAGTAKADGSEEAMYRISMSMDQINFITTNMDVSGSEKEHDYLYQAQLRVCLLTPGTALVSDLYPLGLRLKVASKPCRLPWLVKNNRYGPTLRNAPLPINCSPYLRLNPTLTNTIEFNWFADERTYVWAIHLVKKISSEFLLDKLLCKERRSHEQTKNDIIKRMADVDPDLATTSYRFSLRCPLSKVKIKIPAKSVNCDHLQCFDASVFIQMNEKRPTWQCPLCFKACYYNDIQIQSYFMDVVTSSDLSESCEEIELLSDGTWKIYQEPANNNTIVDRTVDLGRPTYVVDVDGNEDKVFKKIAGNVKSSFVDLTLSDNDYKVPPTVNATRLVTTAVKLQAPIHLQASTSARKYEVIDVDSP